MSERGEVFRAPGVRFVRRIPGPIERIWSLLTEPDRLSGWYDAGSLIEGREGGRVALNGDHIRGVVTQWRPPVRFAHTWNVFSPGDQVSAYPQSYLELALEPQGDEIVLTLVHLPVLERFEAQTAMGWATFLDIVADAAAGRPSRPRREHMESNAALYGVDLSNLQR